MGLASIVCGVKQRHFKTIFISDVHLGTASADVAGLLAFLKQFSCDKLYVVGDLIDFWELKRLQDLTREDREIIKQLIRLQKGGTTVVYIPGNHDDRLRKYAGRKFFGIRIKLNDKHVSKSGQKFLVIHGDEVDQFMRRGAMRRIAKFGSTLYNALLWLNPAFATWSKHRAKRLMQRLSYYNRSLAKLIEVTRTDGVVCGHIHRPDLCQLQGSPYLYANCGDWMQSNSAVFELDDGTLTLQRGLFKQK